MQTSDFENSAEDNSRPYWSVAITASRESSATLRASIESVLAASLKPTLLDVIINGNRVLAEDASRFAPQIVQSTENRLRIWWLELGDKAHAWNHYVLHVWQSTPLLFMVDGYVCLKSDALQVLGTAMENIPHALGGSGVPSVGRSAKHIRQHMTEFGGFHGNYCCIKGSVIDDLKQRQFQLPLGLYRVDSTLGAVLSFGLDPANNRWDPRRIHVESGATWSTPSKHWWHPQDVLGYFKRIERQAQGRLENLAVEYHLKTRKLAPELLPRTVQDLVLGWIDEDSSAARNLLRSSALSRRAVARLRQPKDWSLADAPPIQLAGI